MLGILLDKKWAKKLETADSFIIDTNVLTMGLKGFYELLANTMIWSMEKTGIYGPDLLGNQHTLRVVIESIRGRFLAVEEASYTIALCALAPYRLNGKPECFTTRSVIVEIKRIAEALRYYEVPSPLLLFVYNGITGAQRWRDFREFAVALAKALRDAGLAGERSHRALPIILEKAAPFLPSFTIDEVSRPWLLGACWLGHKIAPSKSPCGSRLSRADIELLALANQKAASREGSKVILVTGDKGLAAAAAASSPSVLYLYKDTDFIANSSDYVRAWKAIKGLEKSEAVRVSFTTWGDLARLKGRIASIVRIEAIVTLRNGAPYIDPRTVKIVKMSP